MKKTTKLLTFLLAVLMLVSVLPLQAFAASYSVKLHCGPEGWGSTAWPLTKTSGTALPLLHTKQEIYQTYGMLPGKYVVNDQRTFIEWNTSYDSKTGRGTGTSYYDYYTADKGTTLYAIWGYNIQFNADGGTFPNPTSGKDIYLTYVASYNLQDQTDPKTDYSYCMPDVFGNTPTKAGCRRVSSSNRPSYALLEKDLTFFCWETPDQNLTIPPTGGYMEWDYFHCADSAKEGPAPEFYAIWEPSVTYNANGGKGSMSTDYLTWSYDALWDYESYTAKSNKFTKSGATFTGWNTKADGTGVSVPVGTQLGGQRTNSDPITLYAQWSDSTPVDPTPTPDPDPTPDTSKDWTITFDPNGGTMVGSTTYGINTGEYYSDVIGSMPTATRSGYTFAGWYNEKYDYTLNMSDYFAVSEDATFVAQWTKNTTSTYTLTFDTDGGTMPAGYSTTYKFEKDEKFVDVIGGYPVPTKSGYTFEGWRRTDWTADFWVGTWGTQPYTFGHDVTLKAEWTKVAHTHSYTPSVTTDATCTTAGVRTYKCSCGDSYTESIAATGHSYTIYNSDGNATCMADGTKTANCDNKCGSKNTVTDTGTKLEHVFEFYASNGDVTCTTNGTMTANCIYNCGTTDVKDDPAKGHIIGELVATYPQENCNDDVVGVYVCAICGEYIEQVIEGSAKDHTPTYNYTNVIPATCVNNGSRDVVVICSVCGADIDYYFEVLPAIGEHLFVEYVSLEDATCTEDGSLIACCEYNCGKYDVIEDVGSALGHTWGEWVETTAPTYTSTGVESRTCALCGETETRDIPKTGKDWKITFDPDGGVMPEGVANEYGINTGDNYKEATGIDYPVPTLEGYIFDGWYWDLYAYTLTEGDWNDGYFAVACDVNLVALWSEDPNYVPADGTIKVDSVFNYTVNIKNVTDVKEIRFARGEYTTVAQIREAEGNLTLSAALAANYIVDGVFTYDVAYAGTYTFCIRHNDGTNDFIYVDVNDINTYLESDGLRLTVKDMKEASLIKDIWIAEGTWQTYTEIKNNVAAGGKYQATATKLANYFATNDFTYVTANPGEHTVLIRYNDGTTEVLYITLTVDVPTFTQNGLQLTIGNIPGVKIIRSAYGEYNSIAEIKTAPLLRCFNNKTAIKDAEEYMIQYREAGVVTVIVEYETGYKHVEHITIEQKVPTVKQDGNTVTVGNLDGLVMVRYAPGKYTTANAIKNAEGSQYVKSDSINANGEIVISNLTKGTWSFCVQYDDESYNYYTITVS